MEKADVLRKSQFDAAQDSVPSRGISRQMTSTTSFEDGTGSINSRAMHRKSEVEVAHHARYMRIFREFDVSGDGSISIKELGCMLDQSGFTLTPRELRKLFQEIDTDGSGDITFPEFCELARKLQAEHKKYKAKNIRCPRLFMTPDQFDRYSKLFKSRAGADGQIDAGELQDFFADHHINVSEDRLLAIMAEVDDDQSGFLDETEFMVLLVKAMTMKKRRVGPGMCPAKLLKEEGWDVADIKRLGYDCEALRAAGYLPIDLITLFTILELKKGGVKLSELLEAGWDGAQGKDAGFELDDLFAAKCSVKTLRVAGYDDLFAAAALRKLGITVAAMKGAGFPLSELRLAGFSATELRLAGYSTAALSALHIQIVRKTRENTGVEARRNTFDLRQDVHELMQEHGLLDKRPQTVA